ncbi:MAG TPA: hypothetical protein DHU69_06460 [Deltaproteobacteria bacterium]|nr:hypothetical protein [Deltaproteobacteria bacterium]
MQYDGIGKCLELVGAVDVEEALQVGVELVDVVLQHVLVALGVILVKVLVVQHADEVEHGPALPALVVVGLHVGVEDDEHLAVVDRALLAVDDDVLPDQLGDDDPDVPFHAHVVRDLLPGGALPLDVLSVRHGVLKFLHGLLVVSPVPEVIVDGAEHLMRLEGPLVAEAQVVHEDAVVAHQCTPAMWRCSSILDSNFSFSIMIPCSLTRVE